MVLYKESGVDSSLEEVKIYGHQFCVYGDPAYILRAWLQTGLRGELSLQQALFSTSMSKLREAVEWGFKDIKQRFTYLDFVRKKK
jgi:hypothetical protein